MWKQMQAELVYFGMSVLAGMLAGLLTFALDLLRQKRWRGRWLWMGLLDLGYWFFLGFLLFGLSYVQNSGTLRGYALAGTLAGAMVCLRQLSRFQCKKRKKEVAHSKKTS